MIPRYVLDAHALVWFLEGNPRLGPAAKSVISTPGTILYLPSIALSEAVWVVQKNRSGISSVQQFLQVVRTNYRIVTLPTDWLVIERSVSLNQIAEMHDRLIAATCLLLSDATHEGILLTCDQNISASGLVKVLW